VKRINGKGKGQKTEVRDRKAKDGDYKVRRFEGEMSEGRSFLKSVKGRYPWNLPTAHKKFALSAD